MTFYMGGGRRGGYVPGRDPVVDDVMRSWQHRYCTFSEVKVCVSTFNVNGRSAPPQVSGWFAVENPADFYVVGLQEMDLSIGTHIIDNPRKEAEWVEAIRQSLPNPNNFQKIRTHRLVGILIVMFKSLDSAVKVSEEKANLIATGISVMGTKLGNKGGTGLSLKMNDTLVCFINCHLAAGNGELERRNQDFRDISGLLFGDNLTIWDHDVVFWFGDLNYRLSNDIPHSNEDIRSIASGNKPSELFAYDQLYREQKKGTVFVGFEESVPRFRPTYKFDVGTSRWDSSEKGRAPAWCDRILWRTRDADTLIVQTIYESVESVVLSDHKPVRAHFQLTLRKIDQQRADRLYEEAIREADRRANELLPQISLSATEVEFGEVFYLDPCCRIVKVRNTGKSTAKLRFMPQPGRSSVSANWMQVTPIHYTLPPNQEMQIALTVVIDKRSAWELFADKRAVLQDILVLSLENGRDYFIPCTASYSPQVFAVSLKYLTSRRKDEQNLIDFGEPAVNSSNCGCPEYVPREIHRLVSGLRTLGHLQLDLNEVVDNSLFCQIRVALEKDAPSDLTLIRDVTPFALYSALMRLIDSLTDPIIPVKNKENCLYFCANPARLWNEVSQMEPINLATIEYLTSYLRELVSIRADAREQLASWADLLFRDNSCPATPRQQAINSLVDYARDVSMFHSTASIPSFSMTVPMSAGNKSTLPNSQFFTRTGSNLF